MGPPIRSRVPLRAWEKARGSVRFSEGKPWLPGAKGASGEGVKDCRVGAAAHGFEWGERYTMALIRLVDLVSRPQKGSD